MTGTPPQTRVLVVGAGPVGLMLAGELRLGGVDVTVLDQLPVPTTESRASTVHSRTMEQLDSRGLLGELGTVPSSPWGHFGGIPLDLRLPSPYPGAWKIDQARIERLLADWAVRLGAEVRRDRRLLDVVDHGDHVEAVVATGVGEARILATHLVACDGEQSTVRDLLRADFPGRSAGRELLRADVAGIDVPDRRFERLPAGLAIAARRPDGVTRVMVHEFGAPAPQGPAEPTFADVAQTWKRVTGEDISGGTPLWVNAFGDANRQLTRYRHGRVLFAGDAAHQQMPVGGQAMNLGLQDAVNLGWKLAAVVRGRAPQGLLDTYHTERHAVGARVLGNIAAQSALLLGGPETGAVRTVLAELIRVPAVRARLAGMVSGLDIRYDVGAGDHPLLGARLPATALTGDGVHTDTAALLHPGRGLLLDLTGAGPDRVRRAAAPWRGRVTAVAAVPEQPGPLAGAGAVLVRPDGYLAWTGADPRDATAALDRWFGPPATPAPAED
ncbi:FAD-dependent monooxygenase [Micromonospora fluostatini]|uniref:FAD-dependent monooxygenase n=1 Tax=Micromonospora sp. JCM 30529 TaxID=3421643 RepID=UPI003D163F6C